MYDESAREGASVNSGEGRVQYIHSRISAMLVGEISAHELPAPLHDLWRDGFTCGQLAAANRIDRAERAADHWYYVANNPAEVRAEHERTLKAFDVAQARKKAVTA
jgi:hypothetical protein